MARARFWCCDFSACTTMMPVGRWVMRTAESVVLTCWPPEPEARIVSMRMSSGRISMSTSSASGSTATVAADVWMRPLRFGRRHALHAVHAGLELQLGEDALARHAGDDFLVAAGVAFAGRHDLHAPALSGGVALVHAEEVAGEQRRLVAAGAGADFKDGVLLVGGVLGKQQQLYLVPEVVDALLDIRKIGFRERTHLLVGGLVCKHRLEVGKLALGPEQLPDLAGYVLQLRIFRRQLHIGLGVRPGRHLRFEHVETLDELVHPVAGKGDHA